MNSNNNRSSWSGSPLVTASRAVAERSPLPKVSKAFLQNHGLPSNALWFDLSANAIMSFDSVAVLRELSRNDVSSAEWIAISKMGGLIILGIYRASFIVADEMGRLFMIHNGYARRASLLGGQDPYGEPAPVFINSSPDQFLDCLVAYRTMIENCEWAKYNYDHQAAEAALALWRDDLSRIDPQALADGMNYWAEVVNYAGS